MPEHVADTVKPRPPIHKYDANSFQREKSFLEEPTVSHHESQDSDGLNTHNEIYTESDSYSEVDDTNLDNQNITLNIFNVSRSVPRTPQRPKRRTVRNSPQPTASTTKSRKESVVVGNKHNTGQNYYVYIAFVFVLIAIGYYYCCYCYWPVAAPKPKLCTFENFRKLYPQENPKIWRGLQAGIENILNKRTPSPAVYLFVHHGSQQSFELVKNITQHSSRCFDKNMEAIEIENEDFIAENDSGYVIEIFKAKIKHGNVILIANLNEIPPKAVRALHSICDTYSPIANDLVIFLTLTINANREGNAGTQAEIALRELWESELDDNEIGALITRVTDQVFILKS